MNMQIILDHGNIFKLFILMRDPQKTDISIVKFQECYLPKLIKAMNYPYRL
jgi:hypothetical protein